MQGEGAPESANPAMWAWNMMAQAGKTMASAAQAAQPAKPKAPRKPRK